MTIQKPFTAVLAGCGSISRTWLSAIQTMPDIQMVGFVDLFLQTAQERAAEFGWTQAATGTDLGLMLAQTRPDCVFDCTVPESHTAVALTALGHGCHLLGEKPLADSMANAATAVAAAQAAGKLYAVIQNRRYDPNLRRLCDFLATGAIGPVTEVSADFYVGAHFGGFRDRMRHVLLLDMAIHTFDAARKISGSDPLAVYCHEWNPADSWYDHDAAAIAIFELSGGLVFTYRGSWCAEGLNTTWESQWRIQGTRGAVRWNGAQEFEAQAVAQTGGFFSQWHDLILPPAQTEMLTGHAGVIREFVDCARSGGVPQTVASDNIKSLAMVFAAIESAERRQRVEIGGF
jgi:predicted dehydrogenase